MWYRCVALGFLLVSPLAAQEKRVLVPEDLYRLKTASNVAVSADGRHVVWVQTSIDSAKNRYVRDLYIATADGAPRQLTWTPESNEGSPVFSPDGRYLAFVTSREGDERNAQIYVLPMTEPGEARRVTTHAHSATRPVWSPDGTRIAFMSSLTPPERAKEDSTAAADSTAAKPPLTRSARLAQNAEKNDPRVIDRLDYVGESSMQAERWSHIYVVDAFAEGATPRRITQGDFESNSPVWTSDGRSLVYSAQPPKGDYHPDYEMDSDLYIVPADGSGPARNLTPGGRTGLEAAVAGRAGVPGTAAHWGESGPELSPDGKRLAYARSTTGEHIAAANTELMLANADASAAQCVSCVLDRSVGGYAFDGRGRLYFTVADRGATHLYRVSAPGQKPELLLDGAVGVQSFAVGGGTLAWTEMKPSVPSDVYTATLDGMRTRRVTQLNDSLLATVHVQPYEEMWYAAPDGYRIQGWIVRPPLSMPGTPPLAVEMHGGPHVNWGPGEASMWLEFQSLAGAGYTVFFANPRGSEGYGFEHKRAIHRNWGDLPMGDVLAGADSVLARGLADPARQAITGGSYAGYLTAWIIGHTNRFDAAVAQRGVYDMVSWWGMANTWRLYESEFASVPWEDPELAWQASPIAYAGDIETPLLLLHGEHDFRVGLGGVQTMFRMLKAQGKEAELVLYPREGHEVTRSGEPHHRVDHMLRILDWFERYVM